MDKPYVHIWKVLSTVLITVFLSALIFGLLPFVVQVYEKQKALSSQEEQIEFMGNWKEQLEDIESKQAILEERIGEMYVELATEGAFSKIVEQLFLDAQSTSVSIIRIQPTGNSFKNQYSSKQISLDLNGTYHSIAQFINSIEQNGLMIEVQTVDIEKTEPNSNILNGSLTLQITMLRS